jgi:hypothetical protein
MHHIKGSNVYRMDNINDDKYKLIIKKEEGGKLKISISLEGVKIEETEKEIKKEELKEEINIFQKMLRKNNLTKNNNFDKNYNKNILDELYIKSKNKINMDEMNLDLI